MDLNELRESINKNVKGTHCEIMNKSEIAKVNDWVSTSHYDLNRTLSGSIFRGVPEKSYMLLVGEEACFKSSMMALMAANSQKKGYTPIMFDSEGAYTPEFLERWSVDCDNVLYVYEPFIDNITASIGQLLNSDNNKFFITIDSIGNLETQKLADDSMAGDIKADQGALAKKIKRLLKMLLAVIKKKNSIGIGAAHYYSSPGMYASFDSIGGGRFMPIAPHIITSLKKSKIVEGKGKDSKILGNRITAITLKNRFYPAFQESIIDIDYRNGINQYSNLDSVAIDAGIIEKGGSWYTNTITGEKVQGASNLQKIIDEDLLNKLDEHVQKTGYSSINRDMEETLKEADEIIDSEEGIQEENNKGVKNESDKN